MKQFTLGKTERLKSRKMLDELFRSGMAFHMPPYRVLYIVTPMPAEKFPVLQFAVGVSSRNFKHSVDRNLIKRRVRESWRQQRQTLETVLAEKKLTMKVFFICTAKTIPEWDLVNAKMGLALHKLEQEIAR
jgi:ribonuclease P protein component